MTPDLQLSIVEFIVIVWLFYLYTATSREARDSWRKGFELGCKEADSWRDMYTAQCEATRRADDRLIAAWKDGYQVPPAESDDEDVAEDPTFSPAQLEWLDQWEDAEARVRWERYLVTRMRNGRTPDGALADAELTIIGGQERLLTPQPTASVVLG